ncbi:MAG TPA: ribosome-associated translation inhibitor RaiA [Planctomycetota bacterium]|nr:ribosome-associated translation inhibitor RaiA [Planctomycetota bacterium]
MTDDSEVTIEFKGRHDHITERMQAHAAKKLARLWRFQDRLLRVEVVADHAHKNPEIELIVHLRRGTPLVARDRGTSFSGTIDLLVDKMETQLRKQKEKKREHKVPNGKEVRSGAGARSSRRGRARGPAEETYEDVVRRSLRS